MTGPTRPGPTPPSEVTAPASDFTDGLRAGAEPYWTEATTHPFTRQLAAGTLDDDAMRRYLMQDYAFIGTLTRFVAHAVAAAPTVEEQRVLVGFLGVLTGGENDYFQRSLDALDVPESDRTSVGLNAAASAFRDLMQRTARAGTYEEILAVLTAAEWVYLDWATSVRDAAPPMFYHREWIELHANPDFEAFVAWLRAQLDARGPRLPPERQVHVARLFRETARVEVAFFDAALDITK